VDSTFAPGAGSPIQPSDFYFPPSSPTPTTYTTFVFLTTADTSPWTVPADWNNSYNKIEVIGGGGGGSSSITASTTGAGGGGGAYSRSDNLILSGTVQFTVGVGGATST